MVVDQGSASNADSGFGRRGFGVRRVFLVVGIALTAAVAVGTIVLVTTAKPALEWTALPDPVHLAAGSAVGQTVVKEAGGQGNEVIVVNSGVLAKKNLIFDVTCQGQGLVSLTSAGRPIGQLGCSAAGPSGAEIMWTAKLGPLLSNQISVAAGPQTVWRVAVLAGS